MDNFDREEINRRVNILKKLRETLLKQREKFRTYLDVLEYEEQAIADGDLESLEAHIEIEKSIVNEITNFQRVIEPLDEMYKRFFPESEESIPMLKKSLERMKNKVLERNKRNQMLLKEKMELVRSEIKSLRVNMNVTSPYANIGTPTLVDITT